MMEKSLLILGMFVFLVAISTTMPPKTTPASEWGSYYRTEQVAMSAAFEIAFAAFDENERERQWDYYYGISNPLTECSVTDVIGAYSRYYKNIDEAKANQYILSYFCIESYRYEHLRVDIADISDPSTVIFVKFYEGDHYGFDSLRDLNINASRRNENRYENILIGDDAKAEVEEIFNQCKVELTESMPGGCKDPTLQTQFKLKTKEENALTYWMFPVACTLTTPNDYFAEIEVFQDKTNYYVNDGAIGLVGVNGLVSNENYHIEMAE